MQILNINSSNLWHKTKWNHKKTSQNSTKLNEIKSNQIKTNPFVLTTQSLSAFQMKLNLCKLNSLTAKEFNSNTKWYSPIQMIWFYITITLHSLTRKPYTFWHGYCLSALNYMTLPTDIDWQNSSLGTILRLPHWSTWNTWITTLQGIKSHTKSHKFQFPSL